MSNYHRPDAKVIQNLKDIANKLRIHSINATNASNSGWACDMPVVRFGKDCLRLLKLLFCIKTLKNISSNHCHRVCHILCMQTSCFINDSNKSLCRRRTYRSVVFASWRQSVSTSDALFIRHTWVFLPKAMIQLSCFGRAHSPEHTDTPCRSDCTSSLSVPCMHCGLKMQLWMFILIIINKDLYIAQIHSAMSAEMAVW